MDSIFQCRFFGGPEQILLGRTPLHLSLQTDKNLFRILRVTALKQITKNCLKPVAPQQSKWKDLINEVYEMEIINHRIRNVSKLFEVRWKRIQIFLEPGDIPRTK